jgi:Na+-translocating ferredoxin:NAD+ oxidoreductase RnfC subunit
VQPDAAKCLLHTSSRTPEEIVAWVREAGVIGAGGTGFPTDVKLQSSASIVIINGAECEPLLYSDKTVLRTHAEDVVSGLRLAMTATGATQGVIALNRDDLAGITAIRVAVAEAADPRVSVHLLDNYYPSGDEMLTVYDVTGKVVPEGATPLDVGVLVLNVQTARQIDQAVNGVALTERLVTVTGAVREPKVVTVPIGTRYEDLLAMAGGVTAENALVLDGGPMMGVPVRDLRHGIGKSTRAVTVLPASHFVARMRSQSVSETARYSLAVSGQRMQATDLCPRHLLGHSIHPHEAMIALDYGMAEPASRITESFLCSDCGVCDLVGDETSFTSPRKVYAAFRARLESAGVANPHRRAGFPVHSQYENRKLSVPLLIDKLGLREYAAPPMFASGAESGARAGKGSRSPLVALVRVPYRRHVGSPAAPVVSLHARVRRGDRIAEPPAEELGALYHAPIHGHVSDITDDFIEITGEVS